MNQGKTEELLNRLWAACSRLPNYGGDLWSRGLDKIQSKHGVAIYLSKFEPSNVVEAEKPEAVITITQEKTDEEVP